MILSDTYTTQDFEESPRVAVWDRFTVKRRLRSLCEISVPRNSRNIYYSMAGKSREAAIGLNEKVKDLADRKERENVVKTLR